MLTHLFRTYQCHCGPNPIAASTPCNISKDTHWFVIQALVAAGHVLPKPINQFALEHRAYDAPLSVMRWLLQKQGMTFESKMLVEASRSGRVDILQLAHNMRVPITADTITAAGEELKWGVLVWACRNGVPIDCARMQNLLRRPIMKFE